MLSKNNNIFEWFNKYKNWVALLIFCVLVSTILGYALSIQNKIHIEEPIKEPERIIRKIGCDGKPLVWGILPKKAMKYQAINYAIKNDTF